MLLVQSCQSAELDPVMENAAAPWRQICESSLHWLNKLKLSSRDLPPKPMTGLQTEESLRGGCSHASLLPLHTPVCLWAGIGHFTTPMGELSTFEEVLVKAVAETVTILHTLVAPPQGTPCCFIRNSRTIQQSPGCPHLRSNHLRLKY